MAGLAAYRYRILIGIVVRIARAGNDLGCIHENVEVICYVCASINECYCVVGMGNIVHGAINANVSRQEGAIGTLDGAGVMGMPDAGVIGVSGHNTLAFCEVEEAHESKRGHGLGKRGGAAIVP
jgi:hypothetical protein